VKLSSPQSYYLIRTNNDNLLFTRDSDFNVAVKDSFGGFPVGHGFYDAFFKPIGLAPLLCSEIFRPLLYFHFILMLTTILQICTGSTGQMNHRSRELRLHQQTGCSGLARHYPGNSSTRVHGRMNDHFDRFDSLDGRRMRMMPLTHFSFYPRDWSLVASHRRKLLGLLTTGHSISVSASRLALRCHTQEALYILLLRHLLWSSVLIKYL